LPNQLIYADIPYTFGEVILKKLLILNGSHSDIPLIAAGKELGFYVITAGNAPNLIGHRLADEYHAVDFSRRDEILQLARHLNIEAICSCANDFGLLTASYVAEKMSLPGYDSYVNAQCIHLKNHFKKFSRQENIITPNARVLRAGEDALPRIQGLQYPLMVKPVDLTGGKGITKVDVKDKLQAAIHYAFSMSAEKEIIIEEFFSGALHSLTTFIVKQKVVFYFCDNEFSYLNPFIVSTSSAPAINFDKVGKKLIGEIERIASGLSLVDGILHIQYMQNEQEAKIIEITRRCSGDLYPYPVQYATGIDWARWIVQIAVGAGSSSFPRNIKQQGFCGRHCAMGAKNGILKSVEIDSTLRDNVYDSLKLMNPGDRIDNYLVQKTDILMLRYSSWDEMVEKTENITNLVRVHVR
jgi:biotin carboxylase